MKAEQIDGMIIIKSQYKDKDVIKKIPAVRWNPNKKHWTVPATPYGVFLLDKIGCDITGLDSTLLHYASAIGYNSTNRAHIPVTGLNVSLWRHQQTGVDFAYPLKSVLLDAPMGTGKTIMALALTITKGHKIVLIVCPKIVRAVWRDEIDRRVTVPTKTVILGGSVKHKHDGLIQNLKLHKLRGEGILFIVVNYESVWREPLRSAIARYNEVIQYVILDESHRIKAPGSKVSWFFKGALKHCEKLCLTGTPLPNSPLDAYGQFRFLDPCMFGTSFAMFRGKYAVMGGYEGKQVLSYQNLDDFRKKYYSITYKIPETVLDLPEVVHVYRETQLTAKGQKHYDEIKKQFVTEVTEGKILTVSNALSRLTRLHQITSGVLPVDDALIQVDNSKEKLLQEVLIDLPKNEPVVVFCRFTADIEAVKRVGEHLGRAVAELSGKIEELDKWQKDKNDIPILAVQIQKGSLGVSFVRARYQIYYSKSFNNGDYMQSLKRIHRPGQLKNVTYIHLVVSGTIDADINAALQKKSDIIKSVLTKFHINL